MFIVESFFYFGKFLHSWVIFIYCNFFLFFILLSPTLFSILYSLYILFSLSFPFSYFYIYLFNTRLRASAASAMLRMSHWTFPKHLLLRHKNFPLHNGGLSPDVASSPSTPKSGRPARTTDTPVGCPTESSPLRML